MLGVVTACFNPCGYRSRDANYERFRRQLQHDLFTVELTFGDDPPGDVPDAAPGVLRLRGTPANVMWQKERLVNLAVSRLPPEVDRVAWVDADLLFLNPDWAAEAERLLDDYPVAQLFEAVHRLDVAGHVTSSEDSWARGRTMPPPRSANRPPGGAWAARREVLDGGLYDACVLGGGDSAAVSAWSGAFRRKAGASHYWVRWPGYRLWAERQHALVAGRVGCVRGDVVHLFHGARAARRRGERHVLLAPHKFDPALDLRTDDSGVWAWATPKPGLHAQVVDYFRGRDEDTSVREPVAPRGPREQAQWA